MNKVKIGIVTEYFNSTNCGGLLQAYSLCRIIDNLGYDVEQICFKKSSKIDKITFSKIKKSLNPIFLIQKSWSKIQKILLNKLFTQKNQLSKHFRNTYIPHSKSQFNINNIIESIDIYDIFITGSDQVWNPKWYNIGYSLSFVPTSKGKISYAASMGVDKLTDDQKKRFSEDLSSFDAISVREKDMVSILQPLVNKQIQFVTDPTLLLSSDEWEQIAISDVKYKHFIFCYFLGNNYRARRLVSSFAKKNNLLIVTIPYLKGIRFCDLFFGNIKDYSVDPCKFIYLIKNASYIFTDSFHASLFSCIFNKKFICFQRNEKQEMSSRIYSLLSIFDIGHRFCDTKNKETLDYIENIIDKDYDNNTIPLQHMKEMSMRFLKNSIEDTITKKLLCK